MQKGVDYIGVGVGAVIVNEEGKVFLAKRGQKARNERGMWQIPGGSVEFGETYQDALKREVKEEHGVEIEVIKLLDVSNHIMPEEKQHWVSPILLCRITSGTPQILEPEKCDEIGWFSLEEIQNMPAAPGVKKAVKDFAAEIKYK